MLGVPPDATETELHAAWRRQLKYWHPDRANHPDALEHAKLINLAHDVLTNSTKRAAYDRQRAAAGWRPSASAPSYARPVQWKTVSREGPPRAPQGFDRHGFVARLEEMMNRGRLMIEKRKDLASASDHREVCPRGRRQVECALAQHQPKQSHSRFEPRLLIAEDP